MKKLNKPTKNPDLFYNWAARVYIGSRATRSLLVAIFIFTMVHATQTLKTNPPQVKIKAQNGRQMRVHNLSKFPFI